MRLSSYFKSISRILILAMLHLCWLTSYGYAEMIPTESAVQIQDDRQRILDLLDHQEVIDELEKYGISKVEAVARINSLTDEEVIEIAGKLDELPPGRASNPITGAYQFLELVLYLLPGIIFGAFYIAFTPIAAGVCIFLEDPWGDCIGNYWGTYVNRVRGIYGDNSDSYSSGEEEESDEPEGSTYTSDPIEHSDCDPGMESCP